MGSAWRKYRKHTVVVLRTLVVKPDPEDPSTDHMMVLLQNFGPLMYVDDEGEVTGYVGVFTRIESCKKHYSNTVGWAATKLSA